MAGAVFEYDVEGKLRRVFRIEDPGRPVTRAMIDEIIDMEVARRPARYRSRPRSEWHSTYRDIGIPDTLPAFQTLRVDELGWLWAEIYDFRPSRPRDWVVFDPEGRAQGTVRMPAGLEVQWIGRDAILGVWRDEFDVEYVQRHRLTRGTTRENASGSSDDDQGKAPPS